MENVPETVCKCYLSHERRGLVSCPSCGFVKPIDFKEEIPSIRTLTVQCKCGKQFETLLEVRQHYRKNVKLAGHFTNMTSRRYGQMVVENISQKGIGFRVWGVQHFQAEDLVKVRFELDNGKKTPVVLKGTVRHFQENFVGCRILEIPEGQKELGFYLLP